MPLARPLTAALLAAAAAAAIGCGAQTAGGDFSGAEQDVADKIEELTKAAQDDTPKVVCEDILSQRAASAAGNCERAVQAAFEDADTLELTVEDVRLTDNGNGARARISTGRDEDEDELMTLVKQGDAWRIDRLGQPVG